MRWLFLGGALLLVAEACLLWVEWLRGFRELEHKMRRAGITTAGGRRARG